MTLLFQPSTLKLIDEVYSDNSADLVAQVSALRAAGHSTELVHQVLEQVRLRRKAQTKFGPWAERMLLSEAGLEQASRLAVAAHHAGRFRAAGLSRVADLGCGLGADAMALGALGLEVQAIESEEATAALASYNLAPFDTITVHLADAREYPLDEVDGFWADPARRDERGRLRDPERWSPPFNWLLDRARELPAGIKLAPGMDRELIPSGFEAQWVSHEGETVELVIWSGKLARSGIGRSALVIGRDRAAELTAEADSPDEPVGELGTHLYEPEGAVIRARLIGDLARSIGGRMISPDIAYITTDQPVETDFAQGFRITATLPLKVRELRNWVAREDIGSLEIKKRGVDIDPAALRAQLNPRGQQPATLIATRLKNQRVALVAQRLPRG